MERGWKANSVEISPNCPRCSSSNTKFCYYNNYSSTQPRYFCKGCRRYWTKGGSLRNVPVGGGCRKSTRRGKYSKTLRQANININAVVHDHDIRRASSSEVSDGPNIDLAQVYSSFLNQKPDQVQTVFCSSSYEYSSLLNNDFGLADFSEELDLTDCLHFHEKSTETHLSEDNQVYFCGFNTNQKHSSYDTANTNFELPPLPGEAAEISNGDMLWSKSNSEMIADHALQATPPPHFGLEDDAEFLMSNCWNHFDLPRDASFFTP